MKAVIYLFHGLLLRDTDISIINHILKSNAFKNITLTSFTTNTMRCIEIMIIIYFVTLILKKIPLVKNII